MYLSFLFSFERSCGALAQLGERLLCTQEVCGSIPHSSTIIGTEFCEKQKPCVERCSIYVFDFFMKFAL